MSHDDRDPRLRWEPGEDGILFGYCGTLKPWAFAICPPGSPGEFWMISTPFPLGQPRYVGSEEEARRAAERWLGEFTASLGAVFPDEPEAMFEDVTDEEAFEEEFRARLAPGRRVRFAHPDHGYPGEGEAAAAFLVLGEVYTIAWSDIGFSSSRLGLAGIESHGQGFNSVLFEPVPEAGQP